MFNIQRSVSWSFYIVDHNPLRYHLSSTTAHTTVRHSICVVSYTFPAIFNDHDQYPMSFAGPSGFCCYKMYHSSLSNTSMWRFWRPSALGSASISGECNQCCSVSSASISLSLSRPKCKCWFFFIVVLSSVAIRATLCINHQNTSQKT